jgi:hypothetical protein
MRELTSLAESDRKIALDRYRMLRPHLEDRRALSAVASEAGVAYGTAERWVSLYRRFGLSALARKRRSDRGHYRAVSPKLRQVVEALALQKPPLPIAALHRQICKIARKRGENSPTYKAVYRIVRELPKDLLILAHEGAKAYADAFDLIAPISEAEEMVKALKAVGNDVRFSVLPDRDHYILDVYENQDLYSWFLQHRLSDGLPGPGLSKRQQRFRGVTPLDVRQEIAI